MATAKMQSKQRDLDCSVRFVAIVNMQLHLDHSLDTILQIFSLSLFEKALCINYLIKITKHPYRTEHITDFYSVKLWDNSELCILLHLTDQKANLGIYRCIYQAYRIFL